MSLLNRRQRAVAKTARSAVRAYGAVRHTQGRIAGRRSRGSHARGPLLIAAATGGGAALGFLASAKTRRGSDTTGALVDQRSPGATVGAITATDTTPQSAEVQPLPGAGAS